MESPLDILSRAAGMVSSSNSPASSTSAGIAVAVPPATQSPSDMRLMKRKFEDPLSDPLFVETQRREDGGSSGGCSSRILKKALIHHQAILDTHNNGPVGLTVEDDQPLDMSCKKKRQRSISPDEPLNNRRPPAERTNSNSSSSISSNSQHHHNRPPTVADRRFYTNGIPHKKWISRSNGVDGSVNPPNAKLFLENNNSTSDGSGTDHTRRPSVIYYATQTPDLPLAATPGGLSSGSLGGGGTGKFRRRFRHPSNSSTSTDSDVALAPLIRRKLVKRKRKRPSVLAPITPALLDATRPLDMDGGESGCKSRRVVVITSKEDDIDEHFRRSLGDRYDEAKCFLKTTTASGTSSSKNGGKPVALVVAPEEKLQPKEESKEINFEDQPLSVDDHFAKALGTETWSRLISSKPTSNSKTPNRSPPPYESKKDEKVKVENGNMTTGPTNLTLQTDRDGKEVPINNY